MRGLRLALVAALAITGIARAQSTAERTWLANYVRADDKDAKKLLKRFPGSSNPSIQRIAKLFAAGPARKRFDNGIHHFSFTDGDETWEYTVFLPKGYSPKKRYPLLIDTGHFSMKNADADTVAGALMNYVNQTDRAMIAVRPRIFDRLGREGRYESAEQRVSLSVPAFRALLRELRIRFAVDSDRVFLTGISMSGYWAWRLGAALSGDVAGIVPLAAVTHQVRYGWENLRNLKIHVVHARDDPTCLFKYAQEAYDKLTSLHVKIESTFLEQGGHMAPFRRFGDAWKTVRDYRRPRAPAIVHFAWQSDEELGLVHDLEVTDVKPATFRYPSASGHVRLEHDGNRITVSSHGAKQLALWIDAESVDSRKPLKIRIGKKTRSKRVKPSWKVAVDAARRTGDFDRVRIAKLTLKP